MKNNSWFGVQDVVVLQKGAPEPYADSAEWLDPLFETALEASPRSMADLAACYDRTIETAINAWASGAITDSQAMLLDDVYEPICFRISSANSRLRLDCCKEYRSLESGIQVPTRIPSLEESVGVTNLCIDVAIISSLKKQFHVVF